MLGNTLTSLFLDTFTRPFFCHYQSTLFSWHEWDTKYFVPVHGIIRGKWFVLPCMWVYTDDNDKEDEEDSDCEDKAQDTFEDEAESTQDINTMTSNR